VARLIEDHLAAWQATADADQFEAFRAIMRD